MAVAVGRGNERVYSCYLDELENAAVRLVAAANGASPNAVIRVAVRQLLGLPTPRYEVPESVGELLQPRGRG